MMKARFLGQVVCAVLVISLAQAKEAHWTGWMGPDRDGKAEGFVSPEVWPEKLEQVWRVEVGEGYPTPLVVGERIYQHARQGGEEVLWCLDRKTGAKIWRTTMPISFEARRGGERHGTGPKSTPCYEEGRVFTLSITGLLGAWSAEDGSLLWKRDFQERFEEAHPHWGTATSPIVADGRVYAHTGSCENGALFCIDAKTGKDIWVRDEDGNCYSSPRIETIEGVPQLVELNHAGLCGIDLKTGKLLWKRDFPHRGNNQNTPTPARIGNLFIAGGEDRGIFSVRAQQAEGKWKAERPWFHRDVSIEMGSPVINDGLVYGFSQFKTGQFFCLEPESGEVLWKGEARMGNNGQMLSLPGHILVLTNDGLCRILAAKGKDTEVVRTYRVAEDDTWTAPALVQDLLFIKDRKHLTVWKLQ